MSTPEAVAQQLASEIVSGTGMNDYAFFTNTGYPLTIAREDAYMNWSASAPIQKLRKQYQGKCPAGKLNYQDGSLQ
jgi:hypothetical protein